MLQYKTERLAHPESTEHLVDEKLDFVFCKIPSHLRQVSKHVRHHQVAEEKRGREERENECKEVITSTEQSTQALFSQRSQLMHKTKLFFLLFPHPVNAVIQEVLDFDRGD